MRFDIITIFPDIFSSYFNESIVGRAQDEAHIQIHMHDIRDYAENKHNKVDDKPYGGGAGMVLEAPPILSAVDAVQAQSPESNKTKILIFSAKGEQFTQKKAYSWAQDYDHLIMIAGRYEGIDERVRLALNAEEISIGPYVLTDGELPAMVVVSAVARLVPGVIRLESLEEESHWDGLVQEEACEGGTVSTSVSQGGQLEYPHYTRPESFAYNGKTYAVPEVLLSGDHAEIKKWRKKHRQ